MKIVNSVVMTVALASSVASMAQTSGTDRPVLDRDPATKSERDRPQGGSTAGANGRQDPTIKLSNGTSDSAASTARSGGPGKPNQGGTTAGANGAQDPTIKASERAWEKSKSDAAAARPQPSN